MAPRRKLCKDCLLIVAGWLRGSASCVESGEQPDDTLELDLEVCLADDDGQARPGRCGRVPVMESEWNAHELGDQIEVPADIPLTDEASQEEA